MRPTWAEIDLGAIRSNASALASLATSARLVAVVKADGYGHGAAPVARAALEAGAHGLAVALVEEGLGLRDAGIEAPILVLSETPPDAVVDAIAGGLDLTIATLDGVAALAAVGGRPGRVHLKIDTGMHRMGCDPADAVAVADRLAAVDVPLHAVWTHLAEADATTSDATACQLERFAETCAALRAGGHEWAITHVANSAGHLLHPAARFDEVRCGIALYGVAPAADLALPVALLPALSLHSQVVARRVVPAGDAVSYGGCWRAEVPTPIATVPIGYADGVPRALGLRGGEVLIGGRRCPVRGVVTMDQLMVEVPDTVAVGDPVVLLGSQGDATVTAWEWAERLDTIAYEILTGIGGRVPRRYVG